MKGNNKLMILWNLVPKEWRSQAFIAGGYAACPALASDLDLWIFVDGGHGPSLSDARTEVLAHVAHVGCINHISVIEENDWTTTEYMGVNVNILKVCYI